MDFCGVYQIHNRLKPKHLSVSYACLLDHVTTHRLSMRRSIALPDDCRLVKRGSLSVQATRRSLISLQPYPRRALPTGINFSAHAAEKTQTTCLLHDCTTFVSNPYVSPSRRTTPHGQRWIWLKGFSQSGATIDRYSPISFNTAKRFRHW